VTVNFTATVAESFIDTYKEEYKNLEEKREMILTEIDKEESKFRKTLENGIRQFEKIITSTVNGGFETKTLSYSAVFELVTAHGFPIELVQEIAKERDLFIDMDMFNQKMEEHKELSRTASAGKFKGGLGGDGEMETKYHTATHMLHQALQTVLGDAVTQKGSNITPERLRFDFAYGEKMTDEQKKQVEDLINAKIAEALPVTREEISIEDARTRGAMGLFTDKYGDKVSIYRIGEGKNKGDTDLFSIEMCGGPHIENTGNMGTFKIQKEEAVSAGVRRIKAVLE
jgi:alanyl-tRNA synthetase